MSTKRLTLPLLVLLAALALAACGNTPPATVVVTQVVTRQVRITVPVTVKVPVTVLAPQTVQVTVIVTPTFTPGPTPTPTITPTPRPTATPTPSPTPFRVGNCSTLNITRSASTTSNDIERQLKKYHDRCVKILFVPGHGKFTVNMSYAFRSLGVISDDQSPELPQEDAYLYGIFYLHNTAENPNDNNRILLRRADLIPPNKRPIFEDGLYTVGANAQMSPGTWKSALLPTDTDECYWARLNPNNGDIKANHFGIGGVTVHVYPGEVFKTDGCSPWVYLGP